MEENWLLLEIANLPGKYLDNSMTTKFGCKNDNYITEPLNILNVVLTFSKTFY